MSVNVSDHHISLCVMVTRANINDEKEFNHRHYIAKNPHQVNAKMTSNLPNLQRALHHGMGVRYAQEAEAR